MAPSRTEVGPTQSDPKDVLFPSRTASHATFVLPALNPVASFVNDLSALGDLRGRIGQYSTLTLSPDRPNSDHGFPVIHPVVSLDLGCPPSNGSRSNPK